MRDSYLKQLVADLFVGEKEANNLGTRTRDLPADQRGPKKSTGTDHNTSLDLICGVSLYNVDMRRALGNGKSGMLVSILGREVENSQLLVNLAQSQYTISEKIHSHSHTLSRSSRGRPMKLKVPERTYSTTFDAVLTPGLTQTSLCFNQATF